MLRREAIKIGMGMITAVACSPPAFAYLFSNSGKIGKPISFKAGVHSLALSDGTWNLWVRPDPRDTSVRTVRLRLQVAEDSAFQSVISEETLIARRESAYIVRKNLKNPLKKKTLYFRYIVLPKENFTFPRQAQVSPTGLLQEYTDSNYI